MLRNYLLKNVRELEQLATTINAWNGELDYLMVFENDEEFFNTYFTNNPAEAVRASQFGDYNYNDEYVRFDGYGNLKSYDEWEYEELLKRNVDEVIRVLKECEDCCWIDEKVFQMLEDEKILHDLLLGKYLYY